MKTYRELIVWQKSIHMVTVIYNITKLFPKEETFGLTSQIRRCAVSIPSNIAEGFGRRTDKEFARFLNIAKGALYEFQTQIEIAKNINYLSEIDFIKIYKDTREIEAMLNSFLRKLNESVSR